MTPTYYHSSESEAQRAKILRKAKRVLEKEGYVGLSKTSLDPNMITVGDTHGITSGWEPREGESEEGLNQRVNNRMREQMGEVKGKEATFARTMQGTKNLK